MSKKRELVLIIGKNHDRPNHNGVVTFRPRISQIFKNITGYQIMLAYFMYIGLSYVYYFIVSQSILFIFGWGACVLFRPIFAFFIFYFYFSCFPQGHDSFLFCFVLFLFLLCFVLFFLVHTLLISKIYHNLYKTSYNECCHKIQSTWLFDKESSAVERNESALGIYSWIFQSLWHIWSW